jgi:acetone carboxylase gamma subunit
MKLNPKYSYEFNCILNNDFNEDQNIKNFASLLSDKDRFIKYLPIIESNTQIIEKVLGTKLPKELEFFVVRAEKFKSFSDPVTIEYSMCPEEMVLFLIKEILKSNLDARFPDEETRESYVNAAVENIIINGEFGDVDFVKFGKNLHDESKKSYPNYEFKDIDYSKKSIKKYVEGMFE